VTVVVAYGSTDVFNAYVKDAFHLLLFGCLKVVPPTDKVVVLVVLGDFNVEFSCGWESSASAVGQHHLHHSEAPYDNGERLLDLATSFRLRVANAFFPH
jgi:hypothetical protein